MQPILQPILIGCHLVQAAVIAGHLQGDSCVELMLTQFCTALCSNNLVCLELHRLIGCKRGRPEAHRLLRTTPIGGSQQLPPMSRLREQIAAPQYDEDSSDDELSEGGSQEQLERESRRQQHTSRASKKRGNGDADSLPAAQRHRCSPPLPRPAPDSPPAPAAACPPWPLSSCTLDCRPDPKLAGSSDAEEEEAEDDPIESADEAAAADADFQPEQEEEEMQHEDEEDEKEQQQSSDSGWEEEEEDDVVLPVRRPGYVGCLGPGTALWAAKRQLGQLEQ